LSGIIETELEKIRKELEKLRELFEAIAKEKYGLIEKTSGDYSWYEKIEN